ncbi:MAG: hypothetical protein ACTTHG_01425 [Treponemataceae bacterium]
MLFASKSEENDAPEPISKKEIPEWLRYARRFEVITLGSLPFTVLGSTTAYTTYRWAKNGFDSSYLPNPFAFTSNAANVNKDEQIIIFTTALVTSVVVGAIDLTIFIVKTEKAKKNNAKIFLPENIQIKPSEKEDFSIELPLSKDESFEDAKN